MVRRNGGFIGTDGLDAPDPPTGVTGAGGNTLATISFTAPSDVGTSAITGFVAVTDDGNGGTGTSSPITISSLTNGTAYTARVYAINSHGTSSASDASSSFSPATPRAIVAGGIAAGESGAAQQLNQIQYFDMGTSGNGSDFGDLSVSFEHAGVICSTTRAVIGGHSDNNDRNIDYVTTASTGNATDFGDFLDEHSGTTRACGSSTRGLFNSEWASLNKNTVEYITIASTGNATDFGDKATSNQDDACCASTTRAVFGGGRQGSDYHKDYDYFTIASTGNAVQFGELTHNNYYLAACSSNTRGVFGGGNQANNSSVIQSKTNIIEYITIASTGNGTDFGDLVEGREQLSATSNNVLGVFMGGSGSADAEIDIDKITIASTGNATDFGDLHTKKKKHGASCTAHGGIA